MDQQRPPAFPQNSPQRNRPGRTLPDLRQHQIRMQKLWVVMAEMFGHRWSTAMGTVPTETWSEACHELTDTEFQRALVCLKHSVDDWPPTLPQFRRWAYGLRSPVQAKSEASEAFDANPLIDGTSQWDADRESYDQRDRRKRAYMAACANDAERELAPGLHLEHSPASRPTGIEQQ